MPKKSTKKIANPIYRLKITLMETQPSIWRWVEVQSNMSLAALHQIIQIAMGWTQSHLWEFLINDKSYSDPTFYDDYDENESLDGRKTALSQVLKDVGNKIDYVYDFGDYWLHEVVLERIDTPDPDGKYPLCISGERACPPEDCGSTMGFERFLDILNDPEDEEHESMKEWVGEEYNPEKFDIMKVNDELIYLDSV